MPTVPVSKTRKTVPIVVLILSSLIAGGYTFDQKSRPVLLTGPMVHIPSPGTLVVTWRAEGLFKSGLAVLRGPDGREQTLRLEPERNRYVARFTNLSPGETYSYRFSNARFFS
ncbi:MAG: hypothetical protein ACE5EQ_11920, partial [Phycisphaerae bacterium]